MPPDKPGALPQKVRVRQIIDRRLAIIIPESRVFVNPMKQIPRRLGIWDKTKERKMKNAEKWVNKKLRSGVSKDELLHCVGTFSNKKKQKVMAEKKLNERQYKERYEFLAKVYIVLSNKK